MGVSYRDTIRCRVGTRYRVSWRGTTNLPSLLNTHLRSPVRERACAALVCQAIGSFPLTGEHGLRRVIPSSTSRLRLRSSPTTGEQRRDPALPRLIGRRRG